jgi:acyl carrier protein
VNGVRVLIVHAWRPVPVGAPRTAPGRAAPDTPRGRERLVSRSALALLTGLLGMSGDVHGYRFPHQRLSLSHTGAGSVAAGAVRPPPRLAGLGVDLESQREVDPRATRFFLTGPERAWLAGLDPARRPHEQLRLWTVKEALFKAHPANEHATLAEFRLRDPAAAAGAANRPHRPELSFRYVSTKISDACHLSVAASFRAGPSTERISKPMETSTITFDRVAERISVLLSVPIEKLTPETGLHDLGADSFRLVETVVDLQEEFDSMFTQAELKQVTTLAELVDLLRAQR